MKKTVIFTALAAAAIAFVSCEKPVKQNGVHFVLHAGQIQTKTYLEDMGGGSYQPLWQNGDQLGILFSADAPADNINLKNDAVFTATAKDGGLAADFTGTASVSDNLEQTIYAYYPADAGMKFYKNGSIGLDVPTEQHPAYISDNYTFDPAGDILVAKPHTCIIIDGEAESEDNMQFTRVTSVLKFNFKASEGDKAYGQHVESVSLVAPTNTYITGRICVDPQTCEVTGVNNTNASNTLSLVPTADAYTYVGYPSANSMFASIAPVKLSATGSIRIVVETEDYTITKTFAPGSEFEFPAGKIVVFNLTVRDEDCVEKGGSEGGEEGDDDTDLSHTDVITAADLAATGTSYVNFSGVKKTVGTYAGNSAKNTAGAIQLRSSNSNSGLVSTSGDGVVKSVTIDFTDANTNTLSVYGSNTAYESASDLYATTGNTKQGELIGELSSDGTVTFTEDYSFVGVRSKSGAVYVESIKIVWGEASEASVPVTSVSLDKTSATLEVGETVSLIAAVSPDNATNKSVTWSSNNEDVATVEGGVVTAVAVGTATITVTTVDGNKTATCAVTVNAEQVIETTIADALTKVDDGKTYQITGVASNIVNTTYGNFDLVDGESKIYIYGLLTADGEAQKFADLDIAAGDQVTLKGQVVDYKGTIEIKNAVFVSRVKATVPDTPTTPVYASLAELVAAGAPTTTAKKVTVTLNDEEIKSIYVTSQGYRNGIFVDAGEHEIEIFSRNVPESWVAGGTVSGTLTECDWKLYNTTWELCPTDWTELTYTAPTSTGGDDSGETGGDEGDDTSSWATVESSNVDLVLGTNGSDATVNGEAAIKVGTSKLGGDCSVKVRAGATKLYFHAAAWNGVSGLSLNITPADKVSKTSVALKADTGLSANSPFTLSGKPEDYFFELDLTGITAETIITFTTSSAKRFVLWGVNAE